jgi:hypothetical protein
MKISAHGELVEPCASAMSPGFSSFGCGLAALCPLWLMRFFFPLGRQALRAQLARDELFQRVVSTIGLWPRFTNP